MVINIKYRDLKNNETLTYQYHHIHALKYMLTTIRVFFASVLELIKAVLFKIKWFN
jgi:hypothetical protein